MSPFPLLVTPRLFLRQITIEDAPALFLIHGDAERMRWFGVDPLKNLTAAENLVSSWASSRELPNPGTRWGIEVKGKPGLVGTCGQFAWNRSWRKSMLGYELALEVEGRGYMREALTSVIEWSWSEMSLNRIEAQIHPENVGSIALVERLGFVFEGRLRQLGFWREQYHDMLQYSLLKQEWVGSGVRGAA